jgi:hypothetical protein
MRSVCAVLALFFGLAGCSGRPAPPPPGVQTISPMEYLVESQKPDGNTATPMRQADPLTYRRQDFGGFQDEDAFLLPDGSAILTWSYPPFGPFDARYGDGGERYTSAVTRCGLTARRMAGPRAFSILPARRAAAPAGLHSATTLTRAGSN